jgi:hypothetical protein
MGLLVAIAALLAIVALTTGDPQHRASTPDTPQQEAVLDSAAVDPNAGLEDSHHDAPRFSAVLLFDVSGSTHSDAEDAFQRSTEQLVPLFNMFRERDLLAPQRLRVGTIGAISAAQKALCDIRQDPPSTFARRDTLTRTARIRVCERALRQHPAEKSTDISGALHFASLSLRNGKSMIRGIVVFSDLDEVLAPKQVGARPSLTGVCVVVVSMVTKVGARRPDSLAMREEQWKKQLRNWGAERVTSRSILGLDPSDAANFFEKCPTRAFER